MPPPSTMSARVAMAEEGRVAMENATVVAGRPGEDVRSGLMPPCVGPVVAWGILANAAATGLAAAAYAAAAVAAQLRQRRIGHGTSAAPLLFATIAVYLAVASLRQVAAWRSGSDAEWVDVDRTLYLVVILPAAFVIVPHVHLVSMVL